MTSFLYSILVLFLVNFTTGELEGDTTSSIVTGRIFPADDQFAVPWLMETQVHLRGAEQKGFLRDDGSFMFSNIAPGSYIIEVTNPNFFYEPIRVEINSKGKIRARKVNHIQTSQVVQVPYPLKMKPITQMRYFQLREQWRIVDFLFNPMVLMMVLPLLLVMLLPRVMNDPEAKKEMEQFNNLTKYDMPEMSEMITTFFAGEQQPKAKAAKNSKKSAKNN